MSRTNLFSAAIAALLFSTPAAAITIPTVPVGNPGNAGELSGAGAGGFGPDVMVGGVAYNYRIGTTEVTNAQYVEFLNAVAATDTYELYDYSMGVSPRGGIIRSGSPGSYAYAVRPDVIGQGPGGTNVSYADKPVVYVSWGRRRAICQLVAPWPTDGAAGCEHDGRRRIHAERRNE